MVAQAGTHSASYGSGEVSELIQGRPGLKQFYQSGKRFLNIEPVPQAGWRLMPGSWYRGELASADVRLGVLKRTHDASYVLAWTEGHVEIYRNDGVRLDGIDVSEITAGLLGELEFFGEANTFGIFHPDLWPSLRIFRTDDATWTQDDWPYEDLPTADLGGTYAKTDDEWEINYRWTGGITVAGTTFSVAVEVDGEATGSVPVKGTDGNPWVAGGAYAMDFDFLAADLQTALQALPSLGTGVTVTKIVQNAFNATLQVVFGGDYSGEEYELIARVTNTAEASALSSHTVIGKTDYEDLFSVAQGGPAGAALVQDRLGYFGAKAKTASLGLSRIGEYFDLNIEAQQDNAARADNLRTQTSERIHAVIESTYLLIFTDAAEYFVPNRTIERNQPLNFVKTGSTGSRAHAGVQEIEGRIYYLSPQGNIVHSTVYDEVGTSFSARPESLLASHLVRGGMRTAKQASGDENDAARHWILRDDGRLVCGAIIGTQDVAGYCEWGAAGGSVRDIAVDGQNTLWMAATRTNGTFLETQDPDLLFQSAVRGETDLAGVMTGLDHLEGEEVWADAGGYIYGPMTVSGGEITLEDAHTETDSVTAGLWQQPRYESRPHWLTLPNEEIVIRPGRIHTARLYVIDTTSLAVGANGGPVRDVPLQKTAEMDGQPFAGRTGHVAVAGMGGMTEGPTLVVTQLKPGRLQVRDITTEAKL